MVSIAKRLRSSLNGARCQIAGRGPRGFRPRFRVGAMPERSTTVEIRMSIQAMKTAYAGIMMGPSVPAGRAASNERDFRAISIAARLVPLG